MFKHPRHEKQNRGIGIQSENNYAVVCITAHWLKAEKIDFCGLQGFSIGSTFCRNQFIHGGVCKFLANNIGLVLRSIDLNTFSLELHIEVTGVELITLNVIIIAHYRSPNGSCEIFP